MTKRDPVIRTDGGTDSDERPGDGTAGDAGSDSGVSSGGETDDSMSERASGSRAKLWLLMEADRWVITAGLLGVVCLGLVGFGLLDDAGFRPALANGDPVETFFQAMVTAIVTGVTLVVTINQLVLSQELGPLGDQKSRMEGAMDVGKSVETHVDDPVSPATPASFLQSLVVAAGDRAGELSAAAGATDDDALAADLSALAEDVISNAAAVDDRFEAAEFGTFAVVSTALDFNYSTKIYETRRIRAVHGEALTDGTDAALADLREVLSLFGVGREHVKTLYFQWELINLSRAVLYAAVPALVTATAMILFFDDPGSVPGETLGVENVLLLVGFAVLVSVAPFLVVVSYILRIVTVAKRTLAIGPLVLRDVDGDGADPE